MSKAAPKQRPMPEDPLKLLVYAPAGNGKTYLLGTAAGDDRLMPMVIADFEGGRRSIRSKTRLVSLADLGKDVSTDLIDVVKITTWKDFDELYDFLAGDDNVYRTVALDSLSEMNYLNLNEAVEQSCAENSRHDPDIPERGDYLKSSTQMRKLIRFFRDLPHNVIFTALAMEAEDPRTHKMQWRPSLTGKLVGEIPGLVDIVGYLAVIEEEEATYRSLFVQPTEKFMAKARDEEGRLSDAVDDVTLPLIMDLLEGKEQ